MIDSNVFDLFEVSQSDRDRFFNDPFFFLNSQNAKLTKQLSCSEQKYKTIENQKLKKIENNEHLELLQKSLNDLHSNSKEANELSNLLSQLKRSQKRDKFSKDLSDLEEKLLSGLKANKEQRELIENVIVSLFKDLYEQVILRDVF